MPFTSGISKRNKRGLIVLLSVLAIVILLPRLYGLFLSEGTIVVYEEELNQAVVELEEKHYRSTQSKRKKSKYTPPSSKFNPNEYALPDWMALGLSEKQAVVVLKFTKRGVYSNDDLKQIFVIDEALYALIKDSTFYTVRKESSNDDAFHKSLTPREKININTATIDELKTLYGIGDYFSKKIIEYRDKLGGYVSIQQLLEIYNFNEEKLEAIQSRIRVDTAEVIKININACTAEDLAKHPYIRWNIANSIVKMRTNRFLKYDHLDQLLESELIDQQVFEKIKPYLSVD